MNDSQLLKIKGCDFVFFFMFQTRFDNVRWQLNMFGCVVTGHKWSIIDDIICVHVINHTCICVHKGRL